VSVGTGAEERARLLADLASALTAASTDLDSVLDHAARATSRLLGEGAVVRLVNDDGVFGRTAVYHPDPVQVDTFRRLLPRLGQRSDEGFHGEVRRTGRAVVRNGITVEEFRAMSGPVFPYLKPPYFSAVLAVPFVAHDEYLGSLASVRSGDAPPFTEDDARLATDIAARVALAIATATSVARLRAERENYRQIVETAFEGVWRIDADGVTTFVNARMAEMLGLTPPQMLGRPADAWLDGETALAPPPAGSRRFSVRLRRSDGTWVSTEITASPVRDEDGAAVGTLAMVSDVTERVRNEELRERLAQMERLDSIGQLAGGIAHDFNNLLSIVSGAVDLIAADQPEGSPTGVLSRQVAAAVEQGAALTRQLLSFGRGQSRPAAVVDVGEVIAELEPMLRRTLGEHVELRAPPPQPDARPSRVRMDRGQLQQIIVNLATNARDAMDAGGTLTIECEHVLLDRMELGETPEGSDPDEAKAWFVRLAVSDTGVGMDADALRHAFEPFYTTKPFGKGTGLGLASVYGIVRAAQGLVRLYSEPDHGVTVKIYLPATEDRMADGPREPAPPRPTPTREGARILVVEDTPALAEVTRRLLEPAGYEVQVSHTPADALVRVEEGLIVDLVITDVVMPGLTGPELAARIHRGRPGLPVLYTSGYTAGVLGARADLPPGAELVEKPFTRANLLDAVARALTRP
jgi:two-component system, cell cycle sensor histidine kinase and response regulator CckA